MDELRLELASTQSEPPDTFKKEIEPVLDSLKARYGKQVPVTEMNRIQQVISAKLVGIEHQKQDIINRAATEGKTIEVDALRRNFEKSKAAYQGQDRDTYAKEIDRFVDTLTAKYGNQIPIEEAYAILQKLEADIEDRGRDGSILEWSAKPGFQERRLLLRHNNIFFPPERRSVSRHELSSAKQMDAEMLKLFSESVGVVIATLRMGEISRSGERWDCSRRWRN